MGLQPAPFPFSRRAAAEAEENPHAELQHARSRRLLFCLAWLLMLANASDLPAQSTPTNASDPTTEATQSDQTTLIARKSEASSFRLPHPAAGTIVVDPSAERWNRVVLLARYRVASGDVTVLSTSIRQAVTEFIETVLATVESYSDEKTGETRYRLAEVGIAYSSEQDGKLKVLTRDTAEELGFKLNFIQRQILFVSEKLIDNVHLVARTSTLTIFDTPTVMLRDGEHRSFIIRYFVWVDSRSGAAGSMTWLLERDTDQTSVVATEPIRQLPPAFHEDRRYHVDSNEFTFGIPSKRAFALESLPPGRPLAWAPDAIRLAALPSYSMDDLRELTVALNGAIANSQTPKTASLPLTLVEQPHIQN